MTKYIFVTGGVVSSLGKGITAASLGVLLKRRGYKVSIIKMDPYINVDAGAMSPFQHGEVFVTWDGAETDLDLGHYERFIDETIKGENSCTTGKVYSAVIQRERAGGYNGATVQVIPHITNEIQDRIERVGKDKDIVIAEIGGTVGDIEGLPYLEAIRQFASRVGRSNILYCHVTLVPYIAASGELKTKPSQQSVGILRSIGIIPHVLICRCEVPMEEDHKKKLALFCNVRREMVIEELDVKHSIYEVPLELEKQGMDRSVLRLLGLPENHLDLSSWQTMLHTVLNPENGIVNIAVVGKYISLRDAYKSIYEALSHGGIANSVQVKIHPIEAEELDSREPSELLRGFNGILVPGGFGDRGVSGKIKAIRYARENNIPFLGICLGMQCAVIEFARDVCGMEDADSTEFNASTAHPVIALMEEQKHVTDKGGTMRLGAYPCVLAKGSRAEAAYGTDRISERHRHRYEFNSAFRETLETKGLRVVGTSPDGSLVEMIELESHPWFVACQFHPEFKSTPLEAHPLFRDFVKAAMTARG